MMFATTKTHKIFREGEKKVSGQQIFKGTKVVKKK